jgi:hypothetical protein
MNSIPRQLLTFAAVLAGLFAVGAVAGQIIDPKPRGSEAEAHGGKEMAEMTSESHETAPHGVKADPVRGLTVAENGLRLVLDTPEQQRGRSAELRFRILDSDGQAVRAFDVEHEKRMHLIITRRDLTGFQHLHPTMSDDGTWSTPVTITDAGSYRVFADFVHEGEATTLASDLRVDGAADLQPLPAPASSAVSDGGYDVRLESEHARPGEEADLRFVITKNGEPIQTEPYLGAGGHLVALREGDLAFLHVHPTDDKDAIAFAATFPTEGRYRLFLQFQHDGSVQTVAFTQEVK